MCKLSKRGELPTFPTPLCGCQKSILDVLLKQPVFLPWRSVPKNHFHFFPVYLTINFFIILFWLKKVFVNNSPFSNLNTGSFSLSFGSVIFSNMLSAFTGQQLWPLKLNISMYSPPVFWIPEILYELAYPHHFFSCRSTKALYKGQNFFQNDLVTRQFYRSQKKAMQQVAHNICFDKTFHSNEAIWWPRIFKVSSVIT